MLTNREINVLTSVMSLTNGLTTEVARMCQKSAKETEATLRYLCRKGFVVLSKEADDIYYWNYVEKAPMGSYCIAIPN